MATSSDPTSTPQQPPLEDLTFRPSPETTLGVEMELQILDRDSGDLVPGALRLLDACVEEGMDEVSGEFLQSMIEVKTGVCGSVAEVRDALFPAMHRLHNLAGSLGNDLAWGGTHPLARGCDNAIFPDERYRRIHTQQGWLAYQEAVFGLHIHVGVPGGEEAIGLINLLVEYVPHLIALSASSPFWQGVDTGFASGRLLVFRPSPYPSVPPHYPCYEAFCRDYEVLRGAGVIESSKDLYWDIRPRPQLGTIEFRVCDAPASPACLLGLAALARCLVREGLALLRERPELLAGDPVRFRLAPHNRWLAARYGLQAACVHPDAPAGRTLAEETAELLERLQPVAREAGEDDFLQTFQGQAFEPAADRLRRLLRQSGSWQAVLADMRTRWAREMEELCGTAPTSVSSGGCASRSGDTFPSKPPQTISRSEDGQAFRGDGLDSPLTTNGRHLPR
jgi:carboxylate-amine ligase